MNSIIPILSCNISLMLYLKKTHHAFRNLQFCILFLVLYSILSYLLWKYMRSVSTFIFFACVCPVILHHFLRDCLYSIVWSLLPCKASVNHIHGSVSGIPTFHWSLCLFFHPNYSLYYCSFTVTLRCYHSSNCALNLKYYIDYSMSFNSMLFLLNTINVAKNPLHYLKRSTWMSLKI